jgi:hypothetical protein
VSCDISLRDEIIRLIGIAGKDVSGGDAGRVDSAGDGIRDTKARVDIIAGADVIITT